MFEKIAVKERITDQEIIQLYSSGISQKDIVLNCPVDVSRTQRVLKKAGFSTHSYRATNEDIKRRVIDLLSFGCTYYGIEEKCDISFHSVREIVEKNGLKGLSRKARVQNNIDFAENINTGQAINFLNDYREGKSYISLCKKYNFDSYQALSAYNLISGADIKLHRDNMKNKMIFLKAKGLSAASIAGQLDISPAIVRKMIT